MASLSAALSLHMRWLPVLVALTTPLLGDPNLAPVLLAVAITLFNLILYWLHSQGREPAALPIVLADCVFVAALISLRGGVVSESYLLYAPPIFYMGMRYAIRGAITACIVCLVSYLLTIWAVGQAQPAPADYQVAAHLLVRAIYFGFVTMLVSVIVRAEARQQRAMDGMHARAREQVRRLEAISRITALLNMAPTSGDIPRIIAEETQDIIPFKNCRVHMIKETPEGRFLPMVALYGAPIEGDGGRLLEASQTLRVGEGITGWVAEHDEPLLVNDAVTDSRSVHVATTLKTPNALMAVPLHAGGRVKGVIGFSQMGAGAFSEADLQLAMTLANAAGIALTNLESRESLARQATTDAITGLRHHGAFQADLTEALAQANANEQPLALVLLDIDNFRGYNERMGLAAGDEALRRVGQTLQAMCEEATAGVESDPPCAACFRIGGDEFALVLRGVAGQIDRAIALVQRTIQLVGALHNDDPLARITLSAGLAFSPVDATRRSELLDTAEAALYLVRQTGGNRLGLPDDAAKETLNLRRTLDKMVQASIGESGSPQMVQHLVAQAASQSRQSRHAPLADQLTTEALRALAAAIDAKDDYTRGHSERVATTSAEIARWMGLSEMLVEHITTAARMHDIGKIGVPDHVLNKRGPLNALEQAIMATHPDIGADILDPIHTLGDVVPIVRHHHEHWDGQGYPRGLAGEEIPTGARVVAVADAIDAMITDRPYRRGMHISAALAELDRWAGRHYDPAVVRAALELYGPHGAGISLHGLLPSTNPIANTPPPPPKTDIHPLMHPEPVGVPDNFALINTIMHESAGE
jgi:diguanylate cyclase (GGDEF)-like protein